jgi:hypothetical protein
LRVIDPFPAPEKSDFTVMVSFPGAGNYVLTIMVFYRSLCFRDLRKIGRFFDVFCGMHPSGASSGSAAEQQKRVAHGASRGDANVFISRTGPLAKNQQDFSRFLAALRKVF